MNIWKKILFLIIGVFIIFMLLPIHAYAWGQTSESDRGAVSAYPQGWYDPFHHPAYNYKVPSGYMPSFVVPQLPNKSLAASYYLHNWGRTPK